MGFHLFEDLGDIALRMTCRGIDLKVCIPCQAWGVDAAYLPAACFLVVVPNLKYFLVASLPVHLQMEIAERLALNPRS